MLPSWSDRLHIVLAPDRVSVVRFGKGFKPQETFSKVVPCGTPEAGESLWQPALNTLHALLKETGGRADATVLLSNHFVRYQLIPSQSDLSGLEEEEGYVRFSFTEVYGDEVGRWSLRCGPGLDLSPQVASAVDQALLDGLDAVSAGSGVQISSLQPYLMAVFNHVRKQKFDQKLWFVLVEEGRACLGLLRDGEWSTLRTVRLGSDWSAELPKLMEREFQIAGLENQQGQMLLCLPGHIDRNRLAFPGWSLQILMMTPEMLLQGKAQPVVSMGVK